MNPAFVERWRAIIKAEKAKKARKQIGKVYELLYPYDYYNFQPGKTCFLIEKELETLCSKPNTRFAILMLARSIGLKFTIDTPIPEICQSIQNKMREHCFVLKDIEVAEYLIGKTTGIVDIGENKTPLFDEENTALCRKLKNRLYEYMSGSGYIYEDILRAITYGSFPGFHAMSQYKFGNIDKVSEPFKTLIENNEYNKIFKMDYDAILNKRFAQVNINSVQYVPNGSDLEKFGKYLIELILTDVIQIARPTEDSFVFTRWDDLC